MKSRIGHISLIIAVSGLILMEAAIHLGLAEGAFFRVLATGFEAGTIGALADWFAVSALFHRIPLPLVGRHTNIIVKNRQKLTEAIVELVTTKWLSPEIIYEKLSGVEITKGIFTALQKPKNLELALDVMRQVALQVVHQLEEVQVVNYLKAAFREQVSSHAIAGPFGTWLEKTITEGEHQPLVAKLLKESTQALDEPSTRIIIHDKLRAVLEAYEQQDFVKRAAIRIGRWTGGIDIDVLTDRILQMVREMADEAETDPAHPLRKKLDEVLLALSTKLREGDEATLLLIERVRLKISDDEELHSMFIALVQRVRRKVEMQLSEPNTVFMDFFRGKMQYLIARYSQDVTLLNQIDEWIKTTVSQLVRKYHHEVGNMVRESLLKLNDQELVEQIQDKVGDDLQYIRLNGAVVGGLVGIMIAVLRLLVLQ
ncbi:MAG TPA: DUF445 domain-containing protein [Cyclobacteriaceae bacterium]|nr:DUF445 domain-containing protein [Cyclobacteriaceae bacterium]